ncbi:hypothetical protein HB785_02995 [Listeria welshimeri]|nr:hypothetical protein [Listeria welshimeri]
MTITRSAFKGYVYQQQVLSFFIAIMDSKRDIREIEAENKVDHHFDDLRVVRDKEYYIQIKNYPQMTMDDIKIDDKYITIFNNKNKYNADNNNVIVVNSEHIETTTEFWGLRAALVNGIYVIPLTPDDIFNEMENMYFDDTRIRIILEYSYKLTVDAKFCCKLDDLPEFKTISMDLEDNTILVREIEVSNEKGCQFIIGKPGVGKSHYVNEINKKYSEAIVYRFWVGSQDLFIEKRLEFREFIKNLSFLIFKTPKLHSEAEILSKINRDKLTIIIDGLDHVENYKPRELERYFAFFEKVTNACVVILSRPLQYKINYPIYTLENWTQDETINYLNAAFTITNYSVTQRVYEITQGYPILVSFLANHYNLFGDINLEIQIDAIDDYYELLLDNIDMKTALSIFMINSSFILKEEIPILLNNNMLSTIVLEFIRNYPYLFKEIDSRVSLIHDSFNTYLRNLKLPDDDLEYGRNHVFTSIMNQEFRYLSRFGTFSMTDYDKKNVIKKYSNLLIFNELMESHYDFDSIREFYFAIRDELENFQDILDIYEYYDLLLILLSIERNNLVGNDSLLHQLVSYLSSFHSDEIKIYSSGALWAAYQLEINNNLYPMRKLLSEHSYPADNIADYFKVLEDEEPFFEKFKGDSQSEELEALLKDSSNYEHQKKKTLILLLAEIYIKRDLENEYYKIIQEYVESDEQQSINEIRRKCQNFGIRNFWGYSILEQAKYLIWEQGYATQYNPLRNTSLSKIISNRANNGSFDVEQYITSYLRLSVHLQNKVDINNINKFVMMYYNRKDYSVYSFPALLSVFEQKGFIREEDSIDLLIKLMNQSEKGIRHLLTTYLSSKDSECMLTHKEKFSSDNYYVDYFELPKGHINQLEREFIFDYFFNRLRRSNSISFYEIKQLLESKHRYDLIQILTYNSIEISNVPSERLAFFDDLGIRARIIEDKKTDEKYIPFENGNIHLEDMDYIKSTGITYLELASYTDGWHNSLPYIELFSLFPKKELTTDVFKIIHNAFYAKVPRINILANYQLIPGNIVELLDMIDLEIDWDRIYNSFCIYLDVSMIECPEMKN